MEADGAELSTLWSVQETNSDLRNLDRNDLGRGCKVSELLLATAMVKLNKIELLPYFFIKKIWSFPDLLCYTPRHLLQQDLAGGNFRALWNRVIAQNFESHPQHLDLQPSSFPKINKILPFGSSHGLNQIRPLLIVQDLCCSLGRQYHPPTQERWKAMLCCWRCVWLYRRNI